MSETTMRKPYAVIFDLDGTLADIEHRLHHLRKRPQDKKSFRQNYHLDSVIHPVKFVLDSLHARAEKVEIIILTARILEEREVTEKWLADNNIRYDQLILKDTKPTQEKDKEYKTRIFKEKVEPYFDLQFVVEDRSRVVKMWRSLGVTCLQCADGKF